MLSDLLSAFCSSSFSLQAASEAAAKGQRELHALELREAKLSERDSSVADLKAGLSERLAALAANERELAQRAQQLDSSARQLEAAQAEINAERKAAATKAAEPGSALSWGQLRSMPGSGCRPWTSGRRSWRRSVGAEGFADLWR